MTFWPTPETTGRKIGYARVSTKDQKLRMQIDGLKAVGCDQIFKDHGVSGTKASRTGLDAMLKELRAGDTLVVLKLDRLGRSVFHLSDLLVKFHEDGIHFCSLTEGINTTTPGGKLVYHLFSAFAEFQRDVIAENTTLGLQAARERGQRLGRPFALDQNVLTSAKIMSEDGEQNLSQIALSLGVDRATLRRGLKRMALQGT